MSDLNREITLRFLAQPMGHQFPQSHPGGRSRRDQCEDSKAIHCIMVFVAMDENGRSAEIPPWNPVREEDVGMERYATRIMELRKVNQKELDSLLP